MLPWQNFFVVEMIMKTITEHRADCLRIADIKVAQAAQNLLDTQTKSQVEKAKAMVVLVKLQLWRDRLSHDSH